MTNKDVVVLSMCSLHLIVFLSLSSIFSPEYDISFISGCVVMIWGIGLVLSKKITRLNDWYEKPFNKRDENE